MSIETLHQKVMDTLTVEQLEAFVAKWQVRAREAGAAGDAKALTTGERMVQLYTRRLERLRDANGGVQDASSTIAS